MNALKWANMGETKGNILKKLDEIIEVNKSVDFERIVACENLKSVMRIINAKTTPLKLGEAYAKRSPWATETPV